MPNKKVFNLNAINLQQLALCYGLSIAPSIEHLAGVDQQQQQQQQQQEEQGGLGEESNPALHGGAVGCGEGKKKNMSKLARFKVGFYPACCVAAATAAETAAATAAVVLNLSSLRCTGLQASEPEQIKAKKLLKQQLRAQQQQQQQQQHEEEEEDETEAQARPSSSTRTASAATNPSSSSSSSSRSGVGQGQVGEEDGEGAEFLELKRTDVEPPEESAKAKNQRLQEILMRKPGMSPVSHSLVSHLFFFSVSCIPGLSQLQMSFSFQRERLQFRADGTAKVKGLAAASTNTHVLFDEDEEEDDTETNPNKPTSTSSSSSSSSSSKVASELRAAFLQQMRSKVESVQQDDKARDQQRVRERHLKKRRNERRARQGDAAASGATLRSSEDSESAEESETRSADEAESSRVLGDAEMAAPPPLKKKRREGLSVEALERLALQAAAAS
ncbi:hypothetical protein Emag_006025 [Eimeria magna]